MAVATTTKTSSAASNALMLLLREDPRLLELNLTAFADSSPLLLLSSSSQQHSSSSSSSIVSPNEEAAFAFAAALMHEDSSPEISGWMSPSIQDSGSDVQSRAKEALADVDRKLALVTGLAERLVREYPESCSDSFLRLHGCSTNTTRTENAAAAAVKSSLRGNHDHDVELHHTMEAALSTISASNNLVTLRAKCDRLTRQSHVMESIANRVQSSLQKQYDKLHDCTTRLQRVLNLSSTLKMAMRLQFESKKILGCGINLSILEEQQGNSTSARSKALLDVDLRDLTRAASSVATMESLLADPELYGGRAYSTNSERNDYSKVETLDIVNSMRPEVEKAALAVRRLAASLLAEEQSLHGASTSSSTLGGILQIYFHLNELPLAVWSAVSSSLSTAEKAAAEIFNPKMIQRLRDVAISEANAALLDAEQQPSDGGGAVATVAGTSGGAAGISNAGVSAALRKKKQTEQQLERLVTKKVKEQRAELASRWANAVGEATLQIATLQRVLAMKSDPVSRQNFLQVVAASGEVPSQFIPAQKFLEQFVYSNNNNLNKQQQLHILNLFWTQMSLSLGSRLSRLLRYENGKLVEEVAALYTALRAASLTMLSTMGEDPDKTRRVSGDNDGGVHGGGGIGIGILGGSSLLEDDYGKNIQADEGGDSASRGAFAGVSADSWTCDSSPEDNSVPHTVVGATNSRASAPSAILGASSTSSSIHRFEWKILAGEFGGRRGGVQSTETTPIGLSALQASFIETSSDRLCAPLDNLFSQDHTLMDASGADGVSGVAVLPTLPSRYDLANIESLVRDHLSLADPRQGGGEFGMVAMLCANINDMIVQFLAAAQDATSGAAESAFEIGETYLRVENLSATEALVHDVKLAGVISALSQAIQSAPDSAFLAPYRPSQSAQHEEAGRLSKVALNPSIKAMYSLVNKSVLSPLCRALNQRLSRAFAKMHLGAYLEDSSNAAGQSDGFVQSHLANLYERIASNHLAKFPSEYGYRVACTVAAYSMYAFVSNISLVRPLGEKGRLKFTQDLADLELALEQLVLVTGGGDVITSTTSSPLGQIEGGKPYAELRAVRSMIFWHGFDEETSSKKNASDIASELLNQEWMKDVRPSTVLHFLFSLAPDLLSSPHHSKRISAQEYVDTLVRYDGSVEDGEANAWMTTMACCDSYQQRESVEVGAHSGTAASGDRRVASVLMVLGPELLRRRRR